jgi:TRAP transporter TAXI family solute receptor
MSRARRLVFTVVLCVVGVHALFAGGGQQGKGKTTRISIAAGPSGAAYYAISMGVADVLMKSIEGMQVDVVTTAGAVENPLLIGQHENDLGISNDESILYAYNGTNSFAGHQQKDLRLMYAGVSSGRYHMIANGNITSFEQLKGKHVSLGAEGNFGAVVSVLVFKKYGITPSDFTASYLSVGDSFSALADGQIDAAATSGATPLPAVQELAAKANANYRILSIDKGILDAIYSENKIYIPATIPKGTYKGQDYDVQTIGTTNFMAVNANVDEELVYRMTKAIFENLDAIHASHPSARNLTLEGAAANELIPLHDGAKRYFREVGVYK